MMCLFKGWKWLKKQQYNYNLRLDLKQWARDFATVLSRLFTCNEKWISPLISVVLVADIISSPGLTPCANLYCLRDINHSSHLPAPDRKQLPHWHSSWRPTHLVDTCYIWPSIMKIKNSGHCHFLQISGLWKKMWKKHYQTAIVRTCYCRKVDRNSCWFYSFPKCLWVSPFFFLSHLLTCFWAKPFQEKLFKTMQPKNAAPLALKMIFLLEAWEGNLEQKDKNGVKICGKNTPKSVFVEDDSTSQVRFKWLWEKC